MHSPDAGGRMPQRKIGGILLSEGMVIEEQLEEGPEVRKTDKRYLGQKRSPKGRVRLPPSSSRS